ncbi:MAG: hypothetical protein HQ453_08680, partial [Actinobacteria bacterium]|nr:hypothetical protein [Actinomycetota bacterium]
MRHQAHAPGGLLLGQPVGDTVPASGVCGSHLLPGPRRGIEEVPAEIDTDLGGDLIDDAPQNGGDRRGAPGCTGGFEAGGDRAEGAADILCRQRVEHRTRRGEQLAAC